MFVQIWHAGPELLHVATATQHHKRIKKLVGPQSHHRLLQEKRMRTLLYKQVILGNIVIDISGVNKITEKLAS